MEKIVVLTGHSGGNERLIECLRILFPDCEIQTLVRKPDRAVEVHTSPLAAVKNPGPGSDIGYSG